MSDQMLSLLANIKTAKDEIERLQSSLKDSRGESERLTAEVDRAERVIQDLQSFAAKKDKHIEELDSSSESLAAANVKLTDELLDLQRKFDAASAYAEECENGEVEANKRIEELEEQVNLTAGWVASKLIFTPDQIDAAWADAWGKYRGTDSTAGFSSLEKVGIVACEECGGSGGIPEGGNIRTCPSCDGHGWRIKTSPLVDKCGQFGTGDDDEK